MIGQLPDRATLFQWHLDRIELPGDATVLAESSYCPVQAFRVGEAAWGFQFHLEVDRALVERWLTLHVNQYALGLHGTATTESGIRAGFGLHLDSMQSHAAAVFGAWLRQFGRIDRKLTLPSR